MTVMENITQSIIAFTGTFNIWLIGSIILLFFVNEFGIFVPYLMETVWLLIGYQMFAGSLSVVQVILLWIIAVSGRAIGIALFYRLIGLGSPWITKFYQRYFKIDVSQKLKDGNSVFIKVLRRVNIFSPYTAAFGRLVGLKLPFTLTLSLKKRLRVMILALIISSIIYDTIYILAGFIGGNIKLSPVMVILYSIVVLAVIYALSFSLRCIFRKIWIKTPA